MFSRFLSFFYIGSSISHLKKCVEIKPKSPILLNIESSIHTQNLQKHFLAEKGILFILESAENTFQLLRGSNQTLNSEKYFWVWKWVLFTPGTEEALLS